MSNSSHCNFIMHNGKFCNRPLVGGQDRCILHSRTTVTSPDVYDKLFSAILNNKSTPVYDFTGVRFEYRFDFPRFIEKPIIFDKCLFGPELEFASTQFLDTVSFRGAIFEGNALFTGAQFAEHADFEESEFKREARFSFCGYNKVTFRGAIFHSIADFENTVFRGQANLMNITFKDYLNFHFSRFYEDAHFCKSDFFGDVKFVHTQFRKNVSFLGCSAWDGCTISFDQDKIAGDIMFNGEIDFSSFNIKDSVRIKFRNVYLDKCKFLETDVSEIQFVNVRWPQIGILKKRYGIYDEIVPDTNWQVAKDQMRDVPSGNIEKYEYGMVAELYRRLQKNYIDNYGYLEAADFYVGEQEVIRKMKGTLRGIFCVSSLYKISSFYGQSYFIPFSWLLLFLFLFPAIWLWGGIDLERISARSQVEYITDYNFSWVPNDLLLAKADYWRAFVANLSFVTLNRSAVNNRLPAYHQHFFAILETMLVVIFVTLLLLALRRRFKRKSF